ncbi:hypothetical protein D3C80_1350280 [compost metagenome]
MVSQSSRLQFCAASTPSARPALLTRPRIFSNPAGRLAMACSMALRSRTSSTRPCTSVLADSSAHRASRRSLRRPVRISFQPASAKRRAVASPKPEVAPVMNTVDVMLCSSLWINFGRGLQHAFVLRRQQAIEATDQILTISAKAPLQRAWRHVCACYPQGFPHRLGATCRGSGNLSAFQGRWISF